MAKTHTIDRNGAYLQAILAVLEIASMAKLRCRVRLFEQLYGLECLLLLFSSGMIGFGQLFWVYEHVLFRRGLFGLWGAPCIMGVASYFSVMR